MNLKRKHVSRGQVCHLGCESRNRKKRGWVLWSTFRRYRSPHPSTPLLGPVTSFGNAGVKLYNLCGVLTGWEGATRDTDTEAKPCKAVSMDWSGLAINQAHRCRSQSAVAQARIEAWTRLSSPQVIRGEVKLPPISVTLLVGMFQYLGSQQASHSVFCKWCTGSMGTCKHSPTYGVRGTTPKSAYYECENLPLDPSTQEFRKAWLVIPALLGEGQEDFWGLLCTSLVSGSGRGRK